MSNEEIVCRIQSGGDPEGELMTQLWEQNRAFVIKLARRYRGLAEEDDLVQEAFFGLLQAVRHWDPENGVLFLSYAGYWIQAKMTRSIDRSGVTSIAMRQSIQKYRRFLSKYKSEHGT
ncbi:MAG: sigma-70 family RNA polymerase sigma factor, partial [Clostridiaceae bacterium]|nr:sigma-70 family RNA polymerase sigma factor [Clostridiaceae bacterium]